MRVSRRKHHRGSPGQSFGGALLILRIAAQDKALDE